MTEQQHVRLTALVRGRVQGVGYRAFAVQTALMLDLEGYARNLPDGRTVEVIAEGPRATLDDFVERLKRGPRAARIEDVQTVWGPARGDLGSFSVRH